MTSALRFLVRLVPKDRQGQAFVRTVRSLAKSLALEARNPKRTSYGALELDIFAPSGEDFAVFLTTLEPLARVEFSRSLSEAPVHKSKREMIEEARGYFNSERYWEAHEALETLWRNAEGEEKRYLQGLILFCAAFVHNQKGEEEVALSVMRRAARQLSYAEVSYHGIDVESVRTRAGEIIDDGRFRVFRV